MFYVGAISAKTISTFRYIRIMYKYLLKVLLHYRYIKCIFYYNSFSGSTSSGGGSSGSTARRRKTCISARERNLRRLESNERERMRMHSLNDAFEVI